MNPTPRKKLTKEQGFALIEAFEKSGLKAAHFCSQQNVHYCVFQYWFTKTRKESFIKKNDACLLPIKLNPHTSYSTQTALKISLYSSLSIEVQAGVDITVLKQILEVCRDVANR